MFTRLLILLTLLSVPAQSAAATFRLQEPEVSTLVGQALDYVVDQEGNWTADTVMNLPANAWTRSQVSTPNFGYLKQPLWMRLDVENASTERNWILSFPDASFVQIAIWKLGPNGPEHLYTMNRSEGVEGRPIPKRYYNIPLDLNPGEQRELLVRFLFQTTSSVPVTLEGRTSFEAHYFLDTVLQSLYFGIMLSMFFYNAFLFITTYDRSYLYYICYVLSMTLMMLWVRDWLALLSPPPFILTAETCNTFAYGVLLFGGLFVMNFVQSFHQSWCLRMLRRLCVLCVPFTASLYLYDNPIFNQVALVTIAGLMIASGLLVTVLAYKQQRDRQTFSLLLAWSCVMLGGMLFSFNRNGLLPQTMFFDYSVQFGSALEVLLLSFSLGDKINSERDQKILAQQQIEESEKLAQQARAVQDALIHGQQEIPGVQIASLYQSADTTGGDWYGVFHDETAQRLYVFMGDVTGHGIPSALVTAAVSGAIQSLVDVVRSSAQTRQEALETIAQAVNRVVCLTGEKTDRIMTMAFVCVDLVSWEGTFLNAGHRPPYLVQDGALIPLICRGNMLGVVDAPEFEHTNFQVKGGTTLFLYTDGLFENQGPEGHTFREKQLAARLLKSEGSDPQSMMAAIKRDLEHCWKNARISDDCALLFIKFERETQRSTAINA
ncbi:SpoIIE family protein phosphatase [Oligoflexus tunisiensis]|uniref:SpoIIE family protein phosphatase n=1 Tax=Oligoflexus tunisiensis TaxID=708132 RepID=UPI000A6E565F|nr:SpoIIE family protein phosphatase [Oligoflexus tunisiensis]